MSDWVGIFIILISLFCGGFALGVKWGGEPMNDLISRQAAIDACIRVRELRAYDEIEEIKALTSAQPERKTGHWTNISISVSGDSSAECNRCGAIVHNSFADTINFCPNCGARMSEGEENE